MRLWQVSGLAGIFCCVAIGVSADEGKRVRNPFGVEDVKDPDGKDVQDYAKSVTLKGDRDDANAKQWVRETTKGPRASLEGEWQERWNQDGGAWNPGKGAAQVKVVGDRVYILVAAAQHKQLIELKRDGNRLIGRYQRVDDPSQSGPIVFEVVSDERFDGAWGTNGRWDFRRKLER